MTMDAFSPVPTFQTVVFLSCFLVIYVAIMLKKTIRDTIDIYDLILLSSVAVVPCLFVFFPGLANRLARLVGILFPFLLLFGALFFIVFVYFHRLVVKINHQENRMISLIQELSILRQKLDATDPKGPDEKKSSCP